MCTDSAKRSRGGGAFSSSGGRVIGLVQEGNVGSNGPQREGARGRVMGVGRWGSPVQEAGSNGQHREQGRMEGRVREGA